MSKWKAELLRWVNTYPDVLEALEELQGLREEYRQLGLADAAALAQISANLLAREALRLTGDHNREHNLNTLEALKTQLRALHHLTEGQPGRLEAERLVELPAVKVARELQLPNNNGNPAPVIARLVEVTDLFDLGLDIEVDTSQPEQQVWVIGKPGGVGTDWAAYLGQLGLSDKVAAQHAIGVGTKLPAEVAGKLFPELKSLAYRS